MTSPDANQSPPLMTPQSAAVEVVGLRKVFASEAGAVTALGEIDLAVRPGEFVCLVGPSGCGKTTLLRILAGLETPTAGRVTLRGIPGRPAQAMVFQGQALLPWRSVRDNVAYGLELRGVAATERARISERLMAMVGLTDFALAYPHQLSEGMRQRANIARALAVEPAVLLMDEPFANLDERNRLRLQEELLRLWQAGRQTVVFVTHSLDEAMVLADRIVVLSARPGRVIDDIVVPFPRPRALFDLKGSPEYGALSARLWELLDVDDDRLADRLPEPMAHHA
jgi:NitT/TauT family transport system ATP-binding protein